MPKKVIEVKAKKGSKLVKNGKVVDDTTLKPIVERATSMDKFVAKGKPSVKSPKSNQQGKRDYSPQKDSMRFFIYEALKSGGNDSVDNLKKRASKLAGKAKVTKYATVDSYTAFDVPFFINMLKGKGITF